MLNKVFDFSAFKTFAIYAPNGVMKTSFAKTFNDYIDGLDSKDKVFGHEPYERKITDETGANIDQKSIFVIKSFIDTKYTSDELSTLLVRSELREEYENALKVLDSEKKGVINVLKTNTQSSDCEKEIIDTFKHLGGNLFEILESLSYGAIGKKYREYNFKYNDVFGNDAVKKFVEKNKDSLQIYHDKYFEILGNSDEFFSSDGAFGTAQASEIAEAVADNAFFDAGHQISLKNSRPISSSNDLKLFIEEQINKVINSPALRKQFDKIDKALRPKNIQPLKKIIENDKSLLLELSNYDEFQKNFWESHFSKISEEIKALISVYLQKKVDIERIISEANNESEEWKKTIETFEGRFVNLPFKIEVRNTKDSVLGLKKPELAIKFVDSDTGEEEYVDRESLTENVLSQGEKRAFYLLNTIFEIRGRLIKNQESLFIIDDIADSFDYKNKYAIIEYLKDLSRQSNFYSIILTHNFDFFRTVQSRILTETYTRSHSFVSEKNNGEIKLSEAGSRNITDPFSIWKSGANNNEKHLIACIPLVRNLIDFKDGKNENYKLLTHVLHQKELNGTVKATDDVDISDIESVCSVVLSSISFTFPNKRKKIVVIIDEQAAVIKSITNFGSIVLEDKIILAIDTRLKAEKYMWSQVGDQTAISGSQTGKLFERYKDEYSTNPTHDDAIKILERVNIMTPENIHLNSFMYEPILDMGIHELAKLHTDVRTLLP